ncbi:hypothetical protein ES708_30961 [subsurface metagenome]
MAGQFLLKQANLIASIISASEISSISPSTIRILSLVAPTKRSISASPSSEMPGLILNFPLILPTLTSEIGPPKGISDTLRAAEAASPANESGKISLSAEIRFIVTNVSA